MPLSSDGLMKVNPPGTERGRLVKTRKTLWSWMDSQKGQTIIEILIAIAVGAFVLTAIAATTTITVSNAEFSQRRSEAVKYVEEGIENVRIARDSADTWDEFLAAYSGSEEDVPTGFTRRTTIAEDPNSPGDINRRLVTVTVVWTDGKGEHQASSTTILTNWTQ